MTRLIAKALRRPGRLLEVGLDLGPGEAVVLLGPNGAGKSSLLAAILGALPLEKGSVTIGAVSLLDCSPSDRAAYLAWLPQRPVLPEGLSAGELVALGRFRFRESESIAKERARTLLRERGLDHLEERPVGSLSGGELQRVLLTTVVAQETPFLLIDEPSNHLDPKQQEATYCELGRLRASGRGLIVATHDLRLARLLDAPERVTVIGLAQGAPCFVSRLAAPTLGRELEAMFGVPFREGNAKGDWLPEFSAVGAP